MPLRTARYPDLTVVSSIFAAAFYDEELHAYVFPHRDEYPKDYVNAWYQKVLKRWYDYSRVFVVSYDEIEGKDVITGVAEWQRNGAGSEELWGSGPWHPGRLIAPCIDTCNTVSRSLITNRAARQPTPADPDPLSLWDFEARLGPWHAQFFDPSKLPAHRLQYWELHTLGVNPAYKGLGTGHALVKWGRDKANEENIPAFVCAAAGLEKFYQTQGFEDLVGYVSQGEVDGKANPLQELGLGGGALLWTLVDADRPAKRRG